MSATYEHHVKHGDADMSVTDGLTRDTVRVRVTDGEADTTLVLHRDDAARLVAKLMAHQLDTGDVRLRAVAR